MTRIHGRELAPAPDLADFFDHATLLRGMQYAVEKRAVIDELVDSGDSELDVLGTVRGSTKRPYRVDVWLKVHPASGKILAIEGECSCPVGYNCKHTVALLLTALAQGNEALAEARIPGQATPELAIEPSPAALAWLASLDPPVATEVIVGTSRVVYRLDPARGILAVGKSRRLKKGGLGKPAPWMPYAHDVRGAARDLVQPEDVAVLRLALACQEEIRYYQRELNASLTGETGFMLLRLAAHTGRLFADDNMEQPLRLGASRAIELEWRRDAQGRQRLAFELPASLTRLPTWPLAYFDPATAEVGELSSGLPDDVVHRIMAAPPLNEVDAQLVRGRLAALGKVRELVLPLPQARETEAAAGPPAVQLRLTRGHVRHERMSSIADDMALAELVFAYPGLPPVLGADPPPPLMRVTIEGEIRSVARDVEAEVEVWETLRAQGLDSLRRRLPNYHRIDGSSDCLLPLRQDANGWLPLLSEGILALETAGIEVTVVADFPYQLAQADDWFVDVEEESGGDWFNLDLGVMIGGERVSLVPPLVRLIAEQPRLLTRLNDMAETDTVPVALDERRFLPVPVPRLRAWLLPLLEFLDHTHDGRPRLSRHHAAVLATLDQQPAHWLGGERLRGIGARLKDFSGIAAVPPAPTFRATLRPYQQAGLDWLQFLREYDLAGILADDMGLGKTVQTLAHLQIEKLSGRADRPSLVVAPTSLMANWRNEAAQFTPELRVLTLHGPDRAGRFNEIAGADIVLTTYPLLVRDQETLLAQPYHLLIMDEAQFIKNPKAKSHQVARKLVARHRLSLTGTPLENHLGELWAQFDFLMPGFLGKAERFGRVFRAPIEKQGDPAARQSLAERVRPFLLRRTKEQVLTELPPRTEIVRWVEIEGGQRDLYESLRVAFDKKLRDVLKEKGVGQSQIMILDALLKLRQVCCDPRLVKLESAQALVKKGHAASAKLATLMEMLEELLDEGRKILLFSQFTSMLALIEQELEKKGIRYAKLTGQTRLREGPIADFQEGRVPLFLVSLKAGGTGLNLTAADTVIHYDPWWNPAVEEQATARAHRMGQDKPVFVYKLMTQGTVEEKILALQSRKKGLADQLIAGGAGGRHLIGAEDLDVLFQPLG
ncbi:MAG: DEAD/DEAH box helicase [Sulfurisoma sp.]|nr:DEAD/DEAH box helicase [Sulfurisoma sp.]